MSRILIIILLFIISIAFVTPSQAYIIGFSFGISPSSVQFNIADPNNLITGYTSAGILGQIPSIPSYEYRIEPGPEPEAVRDPYEKYHAINAGPTHITPGKYKATIYGSTVPVNALIEVGLDWSENANWYAGHKAYHLIYPNAVWTYEFEVPSTPPANEQIVLIKIANSSDLIKDITTAGQLGYIGNSKFVNELIKDVQEIEKERTEVQKQGDKEKEHLTPTQKAIKGYKELLKEITEKFQRPEADEFVKQEAYTVLKEDLDYIIAHIQ